MPRNEIVSRSARIVYCLPNPTFAYDEKYKLNRAEEYTWCEDVTKKAYKQSHSQRSC